ncbi:ABC transporter permease subunit [Ferrimonas senticii]|uniref:ABC transporter permease subunit n=1 Tax=Ferrimonas senticii TaxID=394566 RepID=UPI0004297599|nr:ABC transporter permease subunit [Ferrimonas senticii]
MISYLIRRINLLVLTSLMLFIVVYVTTLKMPGDPLVNLSGLVNPSQPQQQQLLAEYQLDHNVISGFAAFVLERLGGDLGISQVSGIAIASELDRVIPASLELAGIALLLALIVGIPLGIMAAGRIGISPKLLWLGTLLGYSTPAFCLGLGLLISFGLNWDLLPAYGRLNMLFDVPFETGFLLIDIPLSGEPWRWQALTNAISHLILPVTVMAVLPTTLVIRIVRTSMQQEMEKPYIRALKARGISKAQLILHHALPNSMAQIFRTMTLQLGPITSSLIVVEAVFQWPGVGNWLLKALQQGDYTAVHSGVLVVGLFIISLSIVLEILHAILNPVSRKEIHG